MMNRRKLYDDQRQAMAALVEREGAVVIHDLAFGDVASIRAWIDRAATLDERQLRKQLIVGAQYGVNWATFDWNRSRW
jgi:hypothetical protein